MRRYVDNRPVDATDPSGLIIVPRYDPSLTEQQRQAALDRLLTLLDDIAHNDGLSIGGCLARAALSQDSNVSVVVNFVANLDDNAFGRNTHGRRGEITIGAEVQMPGSVLNDPNINMIPLSLDEMAKIMLVHELGHAILGLQDPTAGTPLGGNVTLCENDYRRVHGLPLRGPYTRGVPLPGPLQVEDDGERRLGPLRRQFPHPHDTDLPTRPGLNLPPIPDLPLID